MLFLRSPRERKSRRETMKFIYALILSLTINTVYSAPNHELEKRQSVTPTFQTTPIGETILFLNGQEIVYITGNGAMCTTLGPGDMLIAFMTNFIVLSSGVTTPFSGIVSFYVLDNTGVLRQQDTQTSGFTTMEPGTLFTSAGQAFYTTDTSLINLITDTKSTAMPPDTFIDVRIEMSEGRLVSILDIQSGNFTMILTGSPSKMLTNVEDNFIQYSDGTLTVRLGVLETTEYPNIDSLALIQIEPGTNTTVFTVVSSSLDNIIRGPGQLYVGQGEGKAFFVEDLISLGGDRDIIDFVNDQIFNQAFVLDTTENTLNDRTEEIVVLPLSQNVSKFAVPNARELTYTGSQGLLMIQNRGGRIYSFTDIDQLSIFENNSLVTLNTLSDPAINLVSGGTLLIGGFQALFMGDSNPLAVETVCDNIPSVEGILYSFDVVLDSEFKRILRRITRNVSTIEETQTPIQVITGAYTTTIDEGDSITFRDNTVIIKDFFDNTLTKIEGVDTLFVNTQTEPFRRYTNSSTIPHLGPGTLTYSRRTAFFTTNPNLRTTLDFQIRTADVPDIDVEVISTTTINIDGENFTQSIALLKIGGDQVLSFEASSYRTSSDQELLYEGNMLSVYRPLFTGEGDVAYISGTQSVIYNDTNGIRRALMSVSTFQTFSGGEVMTFTDDTSVRGPGRIYVSADGTNALFSSTNLVTSEVAEIIRRGMIDFAIMADQLSTIVGRVYNLSNNSAIVTHRGGGVIYYSTFDGRMEALYIADSQRTINRLQQDLSALIPLTKSVAQEDLGIIRFVYNGRVIYSYRPVVGNSDITVANSESFVFNGTAINGLSIGQFPGINNLLLYDGIELMTFNGSGAPLELTGYGLLLIQTNSDTAFYITDPFSIGLFQETIGDLKAFLISPQILVDSTRKVTMKALEGEVRFGTNVRAFAGSSITFNCPTIGRPTPSLEFFRVTNGGARVPINESRVGIEVGEDSITVGPISNTGAYGCRADNSIPPFDEAVSTLTVIEATAPLLRPGWFPFKLGQNQSIYWPSAQNTSASFEVQRVGELVIPCRVGGRPRPNVIWQFNSLSIQESIAIGLLGNSSVSIVNFPNGRSALVIEVAANGVILQGRNEITCSAGNAGGSTTGRLTLEGIYYNCTAVGVGQCSRTCGLGHRPILYNCTISQALSSPTLIDTSLVPVSTLPFGPSEVCRSFNALGQSIICPITDFRWNTSDWTECTTTCGGGSRYRNVTCLNVSVPISSDYNALLDMAVETEANATMCSMHDRAGERPASRELCNTEDCPIWVVEGEYSECSVTCGVGVQTRPVTCNIITGNYTDEFGDVQYNLTMVNSSLCDPENQPSPTLECNPVRCRFVWLPLRFGQCGDVPLANEFPHCAQRGFYCYNDDLSPKFPDSERVVNDSFCADVTPVYTSLGSCGGGRCFNGIWQSSRLSQCSTSCGCGIKTRTVQCLSPLTLTPVSNEYCDIGTRPPLIVKCLIRNCARRCEGDEIRHCTNLKNWDMCDTPAALGTSGLRCCDTCLGLLGEDQEPCK